MGGFISELKKIKKFPERYPHKIPQTASFFYASLGKSHSQSGWRVYAESRGFD